MSQTATLPWFARHELRLVWREFSVMMTAGRRRHERLVGLVVLVIAVLAHFLAYALLAPFAEAGIRPERATLALISVSAFLSWTLMLSQAMESVTRAFYARADMDLILSSPAPAERVFAIRMGSIALSTLALALLLAGPFINVLIATDGPRWLAAYGVLGAMAAASAALAILLAVALFRSLGPKRTRLIAQIVAAVVGAAFVIGIQAAAILTYGTYSRVDLLLSPEFLAAVPPADSLVWWPARAAMGDLILLPAVMAAGFGLLLLVVLFFSRDFGDHVLAASSVSFGVKRQKRRLGFRQASTKSALRRKEWTLLRRDPWLVSQTLMQVLYLLPPALLLWRNFGSGLGSLTILVPVLVMAAGQLAGGLAWLAVSGEDAPDLVASAPIDPRAIILAKIEAVLAAIALITAPLVISLALAAPRLGLIAALGIAAAAASATLIQIWFRAQAKRSAFRRRQTSSRIATFSEAFASISWAGSAGLAAAGSWHALSGAALAFLVLLASWMIRPQQSEAA